jgi:hypothetical protein
MEEIWSSLVDWFKEKTSSPIYFTYFALFITWNWRLFHVLFFEDSSLFNVPRIEYVSSFLDFHGQPTNLLWVNQILEFCINIIWHILPPAILTFFAIVYLPKLYFWAYSLHLESYLNRKKLYDEKISEYEKSKTRQLKEVATQKVEQVSQIKRIKSTQTQEEKWEEESKNVEKDAQYISSLRAAHNAFYKTGGRYTTDINSARDQNYRTYLEPRFLSRLDTLGLIDIGKDGIEFTEKGKFFLSRLQNSGII